MFRTFSNLFLRIPSSPVVCQCRFLPRKPRISDPGIAGRVKMLQDEKSAVIEPEDVEADLETDFMNAGQMHRQYEQEERRHREKVAFWITREKYFKRKLPNFLTWSEKEQIRFLQRDSPSEWTAEKLAESFPADVITIQKILKSNWLPTNEKRILKHDEHVQRNWEAFRRGKVEDLSDELKEHLQKFAHRKFDPSATPKIHMENSRETALKLPMGEFGRIITSCKAYKQIESTAEKQLTVEAPKKPRFAPKLAHSKNVTLSALKASDGDAETAALQTATTNSPIPISGDEMEIFNVKEFNSVPVAKQKKSSKVQQVQQQNIRLKIYIPRHLWRQGRTYKIDDCFYDDDGEFLYRVPGMTGC